MEVGALLQSAVENKASDIHLTVGLPPTLRIHGKLIKLDEEILSPEDTERMALTFMTNEHKGKLEFFGQVEFSYSTAELSRFRISIFKQRGSIGLAIRIVPLQIPSFESLNLPKVLMDLTSLKHGLIIVTGPKGSGKSTTLAAILNHLNQNENLHILTIENPIEYLHKHNHAMINQRELGRDTNSYSDALKIAVKQDPDVIMIDELEELSTIAAALNAAEKGYLVLTTLHTLGTVSTVERLVDSFPKEQQQQIRTQLSNVLQGVVSQQLINKSDGSGRIAAMEIMICNPAIRSHIREGKTQQITNSIQTSKREGMFSMDTHLVELCKLNQISEEECIAHSMDKDWVMKML